EDGEHDGLQEERLGEGAAHGEDGRAEEEALPLAVADDVTAEAVVAEVLQGLLADDALLAQPRDLGGGEGEVGDRVEEPPGPGDDAVASAPRQPAGEDLEDAGPVGGTGLEGRLEHGQLVAVGEQSGGRA